MAKGILVNQFTEYGSTDNTMQ